VRIDGFYSNKLFRQKGYVLIGLTPESLDSYLVCPQLTLYLLNSSHWKHEQRTWNWKVETTELKLSPGSSLTQLQFPHSLNQSVYSISMGLVSPRRDEVQLLQLFELLRDVCAYQVA